MLLLGRLAELYLVLEDDVTLHPCIVELLPCAVDAIEALDASWHSIRFDCFSRFVYLDADARRPRPNFLHDGRVHRIRRRSTDVYVNHAPADVGHGANITN